MAIYTQLTSEQRYQIYVLLKAEQTMTCIAELIGVHKSTISREIARNTGGCGYRPIQAQRLCNQRKQGKYAGRFSACDWQFIDHLLSDQQWSPEQISLRLKEDDILEISHERIYQHIILDKLTGGVLHTYLRERVKRRKRYGQRAQRKDS
jgi:IS30 family transposase